MKSDEEKLAELTEIIGGLMKIGSAAALVDTVSEMINESVAAEREACAQIAAKIGQKHFHIYRERDPEETGDTIAAAIRARGQEAE